MYNYALKVFSRPDNSAFTVEMPEEGELKRYTDKEIKINDLIKHKGSYVYATSNSEKFEITPRYQIKSTNMMDSYKYTYKYVRFIAVTRPYRSSLNYTFMAFLNEEDLYINYFDEEEQIKSYSFKDDFSGAITYRISDNKNTILGLVSTT